MSEARHAYMILAHHRPDLLAELLAALDDPRNDIFVHIDAKAAPEMDPEHFACRHAKLSFVDRIKVNWGGYSQVRAIFKLLDAALATGEHERYHLLTGASYPLKSQDEIFAYCAARPKEEFVGIELKLHSERVDSLHIFNEVGCIDGTQAWPVRAWNSLLRRVSWRFAELQSSLGLRRSERLGVEFKKGLAYWSLTQEAAAYIAGKQKLSRRLFRYAAAPDEYLAQTLLANSSFADRIEGHMDLDSQRWTTWNTETLRGLERPGHNLIMEDLDQAFDSGCLFALKFEGPDGPELIARIKERIS